jgi:hypothetical protein
MTDTHRTRCGRKFVAFLGMAVVLAVAPIILAGCASTGNGAAYAVRELHSMTPCGMMMEAMMEHTQGDQPTVETSTER